MDPLTQASLGGAIGAAFFHKHLGRRAVLFGALAGMSPDLDVLAGLWSDEWDTLAAHRGSSHSLVVLPIVAPVVGFLGSKAFDGGRDLKTWIHLAFWAMWTHPILDSFTTYGTQLLAPFSSKRFVFDAVAIIDPLFTLPLLVTLLLTYTPWGNSDRLQRWGRVALLWGVSYLAFGFALTVHAQSVARQELKAAGFAAVDVRAGTPFFFPLIRRISAYDEQGTFRVGFRSAVAPRPIQWTELPSDQGPEVQRAKEHRGAEVFSWFADGFVQATKDGEHVILHDRRYGLISKPSFTPFHARATFDDDGEVVDVRQIPRGDGRSLSVKAELRQGWDLLWGRPSLGK